VNAVQRQEATLREAAETLGVPPDQVPKAAKRFFDEWKELKKQVEKLTVEAAGAKSVRLLQGAETLGTVRFIGQAGPFSSEEIQTLGKELASEPHVVAALASEADGTILIVRASDVTFDLTKLRGVFDAFEGRGGGKADLLRGKVAPDRAKAAVDWVRSTIAKG
jgi:alanyl-tRNA synthetase